MRRIPLTATAAAMVVGIATCLSWGVFPTASTTVVDGPTTPESRFVDLNGWNSYLDVREIPLPNWLPLLVAVALAAWTWADRRAGRSGLATALILYGTIHGLIASKAALMRHGDGSSGFGAFIVLFTFVALLVAFSKADPEPESAAPEPIS